MSTAEENALNGLDNPQESTHSTEEPIKSLGKVERVDYTTDDVNETHRKFGWHRVELDELPTKGIYYDDGINITIKAATTDEIRYFSAMDETNPYSVEEGIMDLLKICLRVTLPNKRGSWQDLLDEDKVAVILAIKELTFAEDENKISFTVKCPSCGTNNEMVIKNENFQSRELDDKISKYYNISTKGFDVKTKSFGDISIKPPTLGIMSVVSDYIKSLSQSGQDIKDEMPFLKVLPYMVSDWRGFTLDSISDYKVEFLRWSSGRFLFFTKLCESIQVGVQSKMKINCTDCGTKIEADVQLPTGIKGLFIIEDILDNELI